MYMYVCTEVPVRYRYDYLLLWYILANAKLLIPSTVKRQCETTTG